MNIFNTIERDSKIRKMYQMLTQSDFEGNYEDTFVIETLFTLLTIDLVANAQFPKRYTGKQMYELALEVKRIYETDDNEYSYFSVRNWVEATFDYMDNEKKTYKDIHKMSTYVLREDVRKYLKQGDE